MPGRTASVLGPFQGGVKKKFSVLGLRNS